MTFAEPGQSWVQALIDATLFAEPPLIVIDARSAQAPEAAEAVN